MQPKMCRNKSGHLIFWNSDKKRVQLLHRAIWEKYYGPIEPGIIIHHINGDLDDNDIENSEAMEHGKHTKLHEDLKAKKECGNSNFRKCFICHQYDDRNNMRKHHDGGHFHLQCKKTYMKKYQQERRRLNGYGG